MIDDGLAYMDERPLPDVPVVRRQRVAKPSRKGNPNSRVRKAYASRGDDATLSCWIKTGKPHLPTQAELLASPRAVSPALLRKPWVVDGRSKFWRGGVRDPSAAPHVLVSGHSNVKIGRDVRKGWLRGYWIYTLTLEERATCYGNNMPYAHRFDHRRDGLLKIAIDRDVERLLAVRGRAGILVRLHALGDFFDAKYVAFWSGLLDRHPRLAVYGYTAWAPDSGRQGPPRPALCGTLVERRRRDRLHRARSSG